MAKKVKASLLGPLPLRLDDVMVSGKDGRGRRWMRVERREVLGERIFRRGGVLPPVIMRVPEYGRVLSRTRKRLGRADDAELWRQTVAELGPKPELDPPLSLEEAIDYLIPPGESE